MDLTIKEFDKMVQEIAPPYLKESYDNVGLMVGDDNKEVRNILCALDCTTDVIKEAKNEKCDLIFTHHPLIFMKPSSITTRTLQGRKLLELIKEDINLYASHTNLDKVRGGINDVAAELLEGDRVELLTESEDGSGIGRVVYFENGIGIKELCEKVKSVYDAKSIRYSGDAEKKVEKVALINGSGDGMVRMVAAMGIECIITGDTSYHTVSDMAEEGVTVIDAGHYATEYPAFKIICEKLNDTLKEKGFNVKLQMAKNVEDPYKTV